MARSVDIREPTKHQRGKFWEIERVFDVSLDGRKRFQRVTGKVVKRFKCALGQCNVVIHDADQVLKDIEKLLESELEVFEYLRRKHDGRVWYVLRVRWNGKWHTTTLLNPVLEGMITKRNAKTTRKSKE